MELETITFWEAAKLAKARIRHDWDLASPIIATLINAHRAEGSEPVAVSDIHPLMETEVAPVDPIEKKRAVLAMLGK